MAVKSGVVKNIKFGLKVILAMSALGLLVFAFIPERVQVDMVTVKKSDILIIIEGEGHTRIHDIYTVSAPIAGRVTRIESEPGDIVTAGQTVIANMYPANPQFLDKRSETQAKADVEGARAALALSNARVKQALAQLDFNRLDYQRTKVLFKTRSVSKNTVERAKLRLDTLQAELETAQSNKAVMWSRLTAAKAKLLQPEEDIEGNNNGCTICIHSPVDGLVLRILHKSESIVGLGTPLVEIGNLADLEVTIEMLSTNAVKVKVGDPAVIKRWGGSHDINAIVRLIEPSGFKKISALGVEEQRVNVILNFTDPIEQWHRLGDAFRVEAAIIIDRADDVITIPLSALFRQQEQWSVFKVLDGRLILQPVAVGRRNENVVEVIDGLAVGEQVIPHPGNKLSAGVRVIKRS